MPKANAQRALGLFGEPSYLGIGDPYDPPKDNAGRHRGVNFTTSPVKKGNVTKYVFFDTTFRRVSEGDTYKMPGANERKSRKEAWEKCTTSNGFVFSHPPKRRTGLGECSGNFNTFSKWQPNNLLIDYTHKTKADIPPQPKSNIMTHPVKKGSFGIPNLTISKGTEYAYMADPYSRAHELEQQDRKHAQAAIELAAGGKPFNSMSHAKDCFDKSVYTDPESLRGGYKDAGSSRDPLMEGKQPMIPSQPPKRLTAFSGCFSKFPKSVPAKPERASTAQPAAERAVMIPSSPPKSMRQTSIMFRQRDGGY